MKNFIIKFIISRKKFLHCKNSKQFFRKFMKQKYFKEIFAIFFVTTFFIFLIINLPACDSKEKIIKIGNQAVFTGDDKFYGQDQTISLKLAASELSPVKIGGFEYKIEIINKDDEGNAEKAFLVAQEFTEERVTAVIGSVFNGTTKVSIPVYSDSNIPIISPSAQGEDIAIGFNNFYRMIINNSQKIENIEKFIYENIKPTKLVLIDDNTEYGVKLIDHLIEIFKSKNVEFYKRYSVEYDDKEYATLAENLLIDEPDYVFFCGDYTSLSSLITKARQININCGFITEELCMNDNILSTTDKSYLEGLIAIVSAPPELARYSENKKTIEFYRKYNDYLDKIEDEQIKSELVKNGVNNGPGPFAPYSYDALYVLIESMKKANSILYEDFSDFLKKTSFDGVTGHIEFNSNGDRLNPLSTVFLIKNGDWVRYNQ